MRISLIVLFLALGATPADAEDGRIGSVSQGSVRISVSVAPRAWVTRSSTNSVDLCVATGGRFVLKAEEGSEALKWTTAAESCPSGGALMRVVSHGGGTPTLLVSPE